MDPKKKAKRVGIVFIALFIIAGLVLMYTGNDAVVLAVRQKEGILTAEQVKMSFDSVSGRLVREAQRDALLVQKKELEVARERLVLRAPEDGKVLKLLAKEGEMVSPSRPVVLLESSRSYYDIYVSEEQVQNLKEGARITGKTVAGDRSVTGTVRLVTKAAGFADLKMTREKSQADLSSFQIRIYIDPTEGVIPGMTIGVNEREFTQS
ncbi:hypothetical protein HMPREF9081_1290 [Centipeda periodontii DSM 2778]|uniref:Uncharacterized protein n=1 Tax=Centipeda periodontii DSM 2778 TaxID=888060 RepID=F5RM04_9FIRM|nr:HlyD family efflux transporter periplasmic adaptor subunit [Centipeda periodontii]EGK59695.1 hypothetical protein HMPREF9081_1290 [Centipeda periodontii DSM 2778]